MLWIVAAILEGVIVTWNPLARGHGSHRQGIVGLEFSPLSDGLGPLLIAIDILRMELPVDSHWRHQQCPVRPIQKDYTGEYGMSCRILAVFAILPVLAGCQTTTNATPDTATANLPVTTLAASSSGVPVAKNPKIGSQQVDPATGARFLREVCLETRPDFANAPAVIAKYPFVQDAKTGAYFHQELSMTAKLWGNLVGKCSVTMAWNGYTGKDVMDALKKSGYDKSDIWDFTHTKTTSGQVYKFTIRSR